MPKIAKINFRNKVGVLLLADINNIELHKMTNGRERSPEINPTHRNLFYDRLHCLSVGKGQNFSKWCSVIVFIWEIIKIYLK